MKTVFSRYLILGGGAAGFRAAGEIRARDRAGTIRILSRENGLPCKRPLLSKAALRQLRTDQLQLHDTGWPERMDITLTGGTEIRALCPEDKTVLTDDGIFRYEKCIYALGGSNFVPPFPGVEKQGVFTVRTENDVREIKKAALCAQVAVVIGGGVVGLETALVLKAYGLRVTVLEALPRLMPRLLDEDTSRRVGSILPGIDIFTGVTVSALVGEDRVEAVELADGRRFPCGLAVISCGQRANLSPAQSAGIACGRGVTVNEKMETSAKDVWACGDCAEWNGVNAALWTQALAEGRVAGANAAGGDERLKVLDTSLILHGEGGSLFALGDLGCDPQKEYVVQTRETALRRFSIHDREVWAVEKRVFSQGRPVGACILGNLTNMEAMRREILGEAGK